MVRGFLRVLLVFINFYLFFPPSPPPGINNIINDDRAVAVREVRFLGGGVGGSNSEKGEKVARPTAPRRGGSSPVVEMPVSRRARDNFPPRHLGPEAH